MPEAERGRRMAGGRERTPAVGLRDGPDSIVASPDGPGYDAPGMGTGDRAGSSRPVARPRPAGEVRWCDA
jgi:hypothetical protein